MMTIYFNHELMVFHSENSAFVIVFNLKTGQIYQEQTKWIYFQTTTEIGWSKITIDRPLQHIITDMHEVAEVLKEWQERADEAASNPRLL